MVGNAIPQACCLSSTAFEILSHPPSRRAFDSQDEFDDTVPEIGFGRLKDDAEFYAVFGDCFDRNARWASCHYSDVPKFGDETASDREVQDFYDFWFGFPSWRVCRALFLSSVRGCSTIRALVCGHPIQSPPPPLNVPLLQSFPEAMEHDPEKAECREERRWMERENARAINKKRRKEAARIRRIVGEGVVVVCRCTENVHPFTLCVLWCVLGRQRALSRPSSAADAGEIAGGASRGAAQPKTSTEFRV